MNRLFPALALAALACALPAFAQSTNVFVSTTGDVTLVAAATAATLQQPAAYAKDVTILAATVYCSVACTVTHSINGTAPDNEHSGSH